MKILHLLYESEGDAFGIGGVGIRAYEIYHHLKERHDVTLLCKKYPGARDGDIRGLRHVFVGAEDRNLTRTLLSYARQAGRFVREQGSDYDIIVEEFSPAIPTLLPFGSPTPVVLQVQDFTGVRYFRKYNPLYGLVLCGLEYLRPLCYDRYLFVSDAVRERMLLRRESRLWTIPNGVSRNLLSAQPDDGDYILSLGRIDIYKKGLDLLVSAYADLLSLFPGTRLLIAGDGRDREKFARLLDEQPASVRKNIECLGWISGAAKVEALRKARFVVFPSRHEAQPIAILEAMACGKASVVSDIPELSFVSSSGAGISFACGSAPSLVRAMSAMMTSESRLSMGARAREASRDATWESVAARFLQVLVDASGTRT